jgi:hypothetical protein
MDRYLDIAQKHLRPKLVVFVAWEVYLMSTGNRPKDAHDHENREWQHLAKLGVKPGGGPPVTVRNPESGKLTEVRLPAYTQADGKARWAPLFAGLRARMKRRGLASAMAVGTIGDTWPKKPELALLGEVTGGLPWLHHSHMGLPWGKKVYGFAEIAYQQRVNNVFFAADGEPPLGSKLGWKQPTRIAEYYRTRTFSDYHPTRWRHLAETNITGKQCGVARLGADFWKAVKDRRGRRRTTVAGRYPESSRRNLDMGSWALAPGPGGPVATPQFEMLREGVQECEARICIERALTDEKLKARLGEDLAGRCAEYLTMRTRLMYKGHSTLRLSVPGLYVAARSWWYYPGMAGHHWYIASGWQRRSGQLYDLAGEVTRVLGGEAAGKAHQGLR